MKLLFSTWRGWRFFLLFLLCTTFFFVFKIQLDNKYTASGPQAVDGVLSLTTQTLTEYPVLFLRDNWAFYQYQFLTPDDFSKKPKPPTTYLFLGQYGGFELDSPSASPYGVATYRLLIETDDLPRAYMLEIPRIYSEYCLWVNGQLLRSVNIPSVPDTEAASDSFVVFTAAGSIELIVAVRNERGIYSGMVYPPAFGLPGPVTRLLNLRLILSSALCIVAVLASVTCFSIWLYTRQNYSMLLFSLLCLCCALSMGRLLPYTFGLNSDLLYSIEQIAYYGTIGLLLSLQAYFTDLPRYFRWIFASISITFCIWAAIFPIFFAANDLSAVLFFSKSIMFYKWSAALILLLGGAYAVRKNTYRRFLLGACILFCALIIDRVFPLYEPILLFWPVESAMLANILIFFVHLTSTTVQVFRSHILSSAREQTFRLLADARYVQYCQLADHMDTIHNLKHEMRSFLTQLSYYCHHQYYDALCQSLDSKLGQLLPPKRYTANPLIDSLLNQFLTIAESKQITMELDVTRLPVTLSINDADLTCLLGNLLQNAVEATEQLKDHTHRHIFLQITRVGYYLKLCCQNTTVSSVLIYGHCIQTSKFPCEGHGLGLPQIKQICQQYSGELSMSSDAEHFTSQIMLAIFTP